MTAKDSDDERKDPEWRWRDETLFFLFPSFFFLITFLQQSVCSYVFERRSIGKQTDWEEVCTEPRRNRRCHTKTLRWLAETLEQEGMKTDVIHSDQF